MQDEDAHESIEGLTIGTVPADHNAHIKAQDIIREIDAEQLEGFVLELYNEIAKQIRRTIKPGGFEQSQIRSWIYKAVNAIQQFDDNPNIDFVLDGSEKKQVALKIINHVVKDLHEAGTLNKDEYEWIILALFVSGDALIDGVKALWKAANRAFRDDDGKCKCCIVC